MPPDKSLFWLTAGQTLPADVEPLNLTWLIQPFDITSPPRRRMRTLPRARVGVIDLTDFQPQTVLYLEEWIEALSPTLWIGLLSEQPERNGPLSDIVTTYCVDYHTQPCDLRRLGCILGHLWGMADLQAKHLSAHRNGFQHHALEGESTAIQQTRALLRRLAQTSEPVLIMGESGTGKNAAARFLHDHSPVHQGPFVAVNCAAIPANLTQSELFGHEKGAFTHALSARQGRIEQADGGTLVLRDIDELLPEQQSTLLRFLQEGVVERLGGHTIHRVTVRVIATSSRSLEKLVQDNVFRADIYYRLGNLQVNLPPLRERLEDLPFLVEQMLRRARRGASRRQKHVTDEAMQSLRKHDWPGNLRELHNRLQRAVLLSENDRLSAEDLGLSPSTSNLDGYTHLSLARCRAKAEREAIAHCLNLSNQNVSAAARLLKISRISLYRLMAKHGTSPSVTGNGRGTAHRKGGLS